MTTLACVCLSYRFSHSSGAVFTNIFTFLTTRQELFFKNKDFSDNLENMLKMFRQSCKISCYWLLFYLYYYHCLLQCGRDMSIYIYIPLISLLPMHGVSRTYNQIFYHGCLFQYNNYAVRKL